jgi:Fur family transcriptional regulator, ferric uptake regulator
MPVQRMTRQRTVILEQLQAMCSHPTADELYDVVRRQLPNVSLGTIYRNLDVLTKSGQVRKLDSGGGHARFDGDISSHHHVRCRVCGRVDDVPVSKGMTFCPPKRSEHGFYIEDYRVEFDGRCPDCSEEDAALTSEPAG